MISKIGNDPLGKELLDFLNQKGVATQLIQTDYTFPTGTVQVTLDEKGSPSYEIVAPVAWDYIHSTEAAQTAVQLANAFVFGSLATRKERSKKTLLELLRVAKFKVFDVNLRPPFVEKELLKQLLSAADIVKMNDEELDIIGTWLTEERDEIVRAKAIQAHFDLKILIVTKGADGAFLLSDGHVVETKGLSIKVKDTIGSGDSFLAGFLF